MSRLVKQEYLVVCGFKNERLKVEIKTPPREITIDGVEYECFTQDHTLADIARWILQNSSHAEEIRDMLNEGLSE